jgi:proteasome lid subunit RPN8/RPN11
MVAQAVAELPNECCGLLAGILANKENAAEQERVATVCRRFPLINASHSPREYNADPRGILEAVKYCRAKKLEVLAIYHSHPSTDAVPSRTDLERNYWPGIVSFIISLKAKTPIMKGWWLGETDYTAALWELTE